MSATSESSGGLWVELTGTAVATGVIMVAGVITGLLTARTLGPEGRGELTASTIWPSTILYAGVFGLADATAYFTARRKEFADDIFLTTQALAVALGLAITLVGWILLPSVLSRQVPSVQWNARLYLLLFAVPCLGSLSACSWLQGGGHIALFNLSRVAVHVATAVSIATLALLGFGNVQNYMGAMLLGNLLTWLVAVAAWLTQRRRQGHVTPALIGPILSYGSRVQIGTWSSAANMRLDQLMLSSLAVSGPLGFYVVAVSYAGLVATLPSAAAMVMLPRLIRDSATGRGAETLATWYRRLLWTTLTVGFCLWLAAGILLPVLFGYAFTGSIALVSVLIPASCILGMNQLLATGFRGHGLPGIASRAEVLGVIVTVPLLALLLPRLGPFGAAITALCACSLSAAYLLMNARQLADLRAFWLPTHADWRLINRMVRSATAPLMLV